MVATPFTRDAQAYHCTSSAFAFRTTDLSCDYPGSEYEAAGGAQEHTGKGWLGHLARAVHDLEEPSRCCEFRKVRGRCPASYPFVQMFAVPGSTRVLLRPTRTLFVVVCTACSVCLRLAVRGCSDSSSFLGLFRLQYDTNSCA